MTLKQEIKLQKLNKLKSNLQRDVSPLYVFPVLKINGIEEGYFEGRRVHRKTVQAIQGHSILPTDNLPKGINDIRIELEFK